MMDRYIDQLRMLVQDPTSNLVAAAVGVSIVALVLLILVLGLLYFAVTPHAQQPVKRRRRRPTPEEIAAKELRQKRARRTFWIVVISGLLLSTVSLLAVTSSNRFCASTCHEMTSSSDSWKTSTHAKVSCVRCHEGTLPGAVITGPSSRIASTYYAISGASAAGVAVPSTRCISCHREILEKTVTGQQAVAMSHKEPLAAGATCGDCHALQGHTKSHLSVGMSACLRCHDGKTASVDCKVCHPSGAEASISAPLEEIGNMVTLPVKPSCEGCHSQTTCDNCHGVRMPHPEDFDEPQQHARLAAFEGKQRVCFRCHAESDCGECHQSWTAHGADINWKAKHAEYTTADGSGYCVWCHKTKDFCSVCH